MNEVSGSRFIRAVKDKDNPYVMLRKEPLNDKRLSWKAKGILAYILSLPDDWQLYESELVKHSTDGKDSLKSGIRELIENGYIERHDRRNEKGHFKGYDYVIQEVSTETGLSDLGKPDIGKPATTNNNTTNNNNTNIIYSANQEGELEKDANQYEDNFERMWKLYPSKKGKGSISKTKKKEIYKLGDEFERCISRYIEDVKRQRRNGFASLRYKNGSTFFNSGYKDYLDKHYKELDKKEEVTNAKDEEGNELVF